MARLNPILSDNSCCVSFLPFLNVFSFVPIVHTIFFTSY
nr:MAG TPA: hypothetical protein [Caudoviricetes sp.]